MAKVDVPKSTCGLKPGVMCRLNKFDLNVDRTYQRDLNEKAVLRILKKFNWTLFGTLTVCRRDGKYWVVCGQHRLEAAKRLDEITDVPCMIYEFDDGAAAEAWIFEHEGRDITRLDAISRIRTMVAYGDKTAIKVMQMVKASGYEFRKANKNEKMAVGTPMTLCAMMSQDEQAARDAWSIAVEVAGGAYIDHRVLLGLFHVQRAMIKNNETLKTRNTVSKLKRFGLERITQEIFRVCSVYQSQPAKGCAEAIVNVVNHKRKDRISVAIDGCKNNYHMAWK